MRVATMRAVDLVGDASVLRRRRPRWPPGRSTDGPDSASRPRRSAPRSPLRSRRIRSIWRYRSICLLGSSDPEAERTSYAVRQLCSRRTIQIVSGLSTAISNGFSRAPTLGLVPSGSQRAPATQSAKPCLSDDAAQLSHVISDVYSRICGRNRQLSRIRDKVGV